MVAADGAFDKIFCRAHGAGKAHRMPDDMDTTTLGKSYKMTHSKSSRCILPREQVVLAHRSVFASGPSHAVFPASRSTLLVPDAASIGRRQMRYRSEARARAAASVGTAAVASSTIVEDSTALEFRIQDSPVVTAARGSASSWSGDVLVVLLWAFPDSDEGDYSANQRELELDGALNDAIRELVVAEDFDFSGVSGTVVSGRLLDQPVKHIVLVGLGSRETSREVRWEKVGAKAAEAIQKLKPSDSVGILGLDGAELGSLVEGFLLSLHRDSRFKGQHQTEHKSVSHDGPSKLELFLPHNVREDLLSAEVAAARSVASAVIFARELVNAPANFLTPPALAKAAAAMGAKLGLETKILDESDCEKMGMGAFLSVGRASNMNSKLIHLVYRPQGKVIRKIGIVGKGVTFDSGGYNIKPSKMEIMKNDMGGSATALGTAAAIAQLKPKGVEVHFVVATCENLISGNEGVLRPGDIIAAMDGTTIEVMDTDAEGRLTLADAMLYCQEQGVTELVDIATLTEAVVVALGPQVAGMWSNNEALGTHLLQAAEVVGEELWPMPLYARYADELDSKLADVKNVAESLGSGGGAITAALFLKKFVNDGVDWAHIDVAGPAWAEQPRLMCAKGGTGALVRTLTSYAAVPGVQRDPDITTPSSEDATLNMVVAACGGAVGASIVTLIARALLN
eukprot:gnl/TRDRNA2_/TRDRNA2_42794_c0_seq1.p1 gnl/TRDRNA2_/TRDRNA2_42794_c0~~gnl/TRDRNA2_/TRDRNA2_42794_c0_seq1.p1  ORF type:complete len:700 (+),score=83.69 gnl/TRDRNA2_/TRDRNA2_42794_c0_seq1:57-2102(+)